MTTALDDLKARLSASLGPQALRDPEPRYFEEPRGRWHGTGVVVAPRSTEGVAKVVQIASETGTPVVPYSGGTGLVGRQILEVGTPIVLSLERMNKIRATYPEENVIVVDAGCTLAAVQDAAAKIDRLFPLTYGSEGTAKIGGALSVNSGGLNVLRHPVAQHI
ncbi:MAG: FAD-binding oxidoreductase, partial [Pseudomonadota bacterium]